MNAPEKIRLTEFSHGGGCGCKIAPAILTEILASTPIRGLPKNCSSARRLRKKNSGARAGDVLVLGKPLGVGILSAVLKKGKISEAGYRQMIDYTTQLNTPGEPLADMPDVHAVTDITGFGLAGHLLEVCRGSKVAAEVKFDAVPMIAEALEWARQGVATGASDRNWKGYGADVQMPAGAPDWMRKLLSDPQTSGGLLVACDPKAEGAVLKAFTERGFGEARTIGRLVAGAPRLTVT